MRLSGPGVVSIAATILTLPESHVWKPWRAFLAELTDSGGEAIDEAVVTYYAAPRSYTAEDTVEIACHGAPVVLRGCLERALDAGARLAEPGEFTLRAFLNGRIDLPRAEAVRDLIEATTLHQARVAARQIHGDLSRTLSPIKNQLLELIALLEAGIDFAEDDVSVASASDILARLDPLTTSLQTLAASFAYGKLVHDGLTLAVAGRPNTGKSSLFNRLLEQDRAIVTDIPGTTRDLVSEVTAIAGIPVKLVDTAGIRDGGGVVESLGIERTWRAMADADLVLVVIDASLPIDETDRTILARAREQGRWLVAASKCDLPLRADLASLEAPVLRTSAITGDGIAALRAAIVPEAPLGEGLITNLRHERLLRETCEALAAARMATEAGIPHEMLLLDLYAALRPLDAVTGATTADDILNRIFSTFCIGK